MDGNGANNVVSDGYRKEGKNRQTDDAHIADVSLSGIAAAAMAMDNHAGCWTTNHPWRP